MNGRRTNEQSMDTITEQKQAAVKPAMTEAEIVEALTSLRASLCVPEWVMLGINVGGWATNGIWSLMGQYPENDIHACAPTLDEAAARFAGKLPPTGPALAKKLMRESEELRAKALKILAESGEKWVAA